MVWLAIGVVTAADTWGWRGIGVACFAVAVGAGIAAARQRRRAVPVHDPPEWVPAQR
jgi:hypothetical protein